MGRLRGTVLKGARHIFPYDLEIPTAAGIIAFGNGVTVDGASEFSAMLFDIDQAKEISAFLLRTGSAPTDSALVCSLNTPDDSSTTLRAVPGTVLATANANVSAIATNTSLLLPIGGGLAYTPTLGLPLMAVVTRGNGSSVWNMGISKGATTYPTGISSTGTPGTTSNYFVFGVKYTDGTWARIDWCYPISAIGSTNPTSTGVNEVGMKLVLPHSKMVDSICSFIDINFASEVKFSIRDANRVSLGSVTKKGGASGSIDYGPKTHKLTAPVYMRAGKTYFVTAESMNGNAIGVTYVDAFEAAAMDAFLGNANCYGVTRDNDTDVAFTEFTSRKYFIGVKGYAVG